ncbi:MAG: hypothetical protein JSU95_17830 [Betaproteobacteria bacterium]|nr:MAG: hypothetical protein JSU95_17830 [Betaproteobacteria bacterium]
MNSLHRDLWRNIHQKRALWCYLASILVLVFGSFMAARDFPGGFDWRYRVASALASQKHNPIGSAWFASALSLSMILLWPYVSALKKGLCPSLPAAAKFAIGALRIGMVCGFLIGVERLLIRDLSAWIHNAHEILALITLFGVYFGVLGLLFLLMLRQRIYVFSFVLLASPMVAMGSILFFLYLAQRGVGWMDANWKEAGIPIWFSLAFWQWLVIGLLVAGLGLLSFSGNETNKSDS